MDSSRMAPQSSPTTARSWCSVCHSWRGDAIFVGRGTTTAYRLARALSEAVLLLGRAPCSSWPSTRTWTVAAASTSRGVVPIVEFAFVTLAVSPWRWAARVSERGRGGLAGDA